MTYAVEVRSLPVDLTAESNETPTHTYRNHRPQLDRQCHGVKGRRKVGRWQTLVWRQNSHLCSRRAR